MKIETIIFSLLLGLVPGLAHAQVQGELGATSTGSLEVSATVVGGPSVGQVRISGLQNLSLGDLVPGGSAAQRKIFGVCLYHTSPTYAVTASQAGVSDFRLIGPGGAFLPFEVDHHFTFNAANGQTITGQVSNSVSETCTTGPTGDFGFSIPSVPADAVPGAYSATITFVMAAE